MNWIESAATKVRHWPALRHLDGVWALLRPIYQGIVNRSAGNLGLIRLMNGMDEIRILPQFRALPEVYEPDVWKLLLPQVRHGDCIVDIGAHYGLYAIALAKRTGPQGQVIAIEADPTNAEVLRAHAKLNGVHLNVEVVQQALSDQEGETAWHSQDMQSVAKPSKDEIDGPSVQMTTLDIVVGNRRVDIILVDIEGYEELALRGGRELLSDPRRRPRLIVIEVHPYNWHLCSASTTGLLSFLKECGYEVRDLDGGGVNLITNYGHVMATPTIPLPLS